LLGHLGLEQWLKSALTPVEEGRLFVGYHEAGKSGKGSSESAGPSQRRSDARSDQSDDYSIRINRTYERLKPVRADVDVAQKRVEQGEGLVLAAYKYGNETAAHVIGYRTITKGKSAPELQSKAAEAAMQSTFAKAQKTLQTADLGNAALEVAKVLAWVAKKDLPSIKKFWSDTKVLVAGQMKQVGELNTAEWGQVHPPPTTDTLETVEKVKTSLAFLSPPPSGPVASPIAR
jgi:hypothetical protein